MSHGRSDWSVEEPPVVQNAEKHIKKSKILLDCFHLTIDRLFQLMLLRKSDQWLWDLLLELFYVALHWRL